jgi:hypothetical protein
VTLDRISLAVITIRTGGRYFFDDLDPPAG